EITVILTSSMQDESSSRADNLPFQENELLSGIEYHHGELGFHIFSPLNGTDPAGNTHYGTIPFSSANTNQDHITSLGEGITWALQKHSTLETPVLSDLGNIKDFTSLQYPTIIFEDIWLNSHYKGIIGITAPPL
ncbi:MAG: hypothetical protein IMY70_06695, partial [Bacteroidetes bacterium]|nr:hypothetical protein [Bacteroidota bacterium]